MMPLRHPDPGKAMPRLARRKYHLIRRAILQSLPRRQPGLPFKELARRVSSRLSEARCTSIGSISWYNTTARLDLEARGVIRRLPGRGPQRLVRVR